MMRHLLVTSAVYLAVYCLAALPATTCAQAPGGAQTSAATAEKPGEVDLPGGGTATPAEDRDRDGFSDAEEALAGTDPKIPDSPAVFAWAEAVAKLRRIGAALERYSLAHKDAPRSMPPDLTTLVREGLLEAQMLTCHCDPYHGEQGGIPDSYDTQRIIKPESEEPETSFFYEFSSRPCTVLLPRHPGKGADWYTVKMRQLEMGSVVDGRRRQPYPKSLFPSVRCFWLDYPHYAKRVGYGTVPITVLNLAIDFRTVYASSDAWEVTAASAQAGALPVLRELGPGPLRAGAGESISFPLWAGGMDAGAGTFRLRSGTGRLDGAIYSFGPGPGAPNPLVLMVEYLRVGEAPVAREYTIPWTIADGL